MTKNKLDSLALASPVAHGSSVVLYVFVHVCFVLVCMYVYDAMYIDWQDPTDRDATDS